MKKLTLLMTLLVVAGLLAGCAGTPVVYYSNCTCPTDSHTAQAPVTLPAGSGNPVVTGGLKTGVSFVTSLSDSVSAGAQEEGQAKYDVSMVAVLVDDDGIIRDCVIDGISASVNFDTTGAISTDLTAAPQTKNELGDAYGMVQWGGAVAEWKDQATALAAYVIGKPADGLAGITVNESGYAADADLATSATIYIAGLVKQIEEAANNARHLGAQAGDVLKLAALTDLSASTGAGETDGTAQLDMTITALTLAGNTITSCYLDGVQAKVSFDATGAITSDLTAPATKNQLGDSYGMVAWGNAIAEWNQQAASFAAYVTGKTAAEVAGIAVDESAHPVDVDLSSSVTIAVGGFQSLIGKACGQ